MSDRKSVFAVVRTGAFWRVMAPGETHRTYDFKVDAEEAALKLANKARDEGANIEILHQDKFGELRPLDFG